MARKVLFYYQTFNGLQDILHEDPDVTDIHLSSIHFGLEQDGQPYIHLNNYYPENNKFAQVWTDLERAFDLGINVKVMIGGAGGGYQTLFERYTECYSLLRDFLIRHRIITGIDLDIEEGVDLNKVKLLMTDIKRDFPHYTIAMAPVQSSLQSDTPGMGGFVYKDLYNSPEGALIDYFNGQFYSDYSVSAYDQCIKNGYPPEKVVMGSLNGSGPAEVVHELSEKYRCFGGVYSWEYSGTPKGWSAEMSDILHDLL